MMMPTAFAPGFPIWGWVLVSLALGHCAGMVTMFCLQRRARKDYCARCTYYLNWRRSMRGAGEHGAILPLKSSSDPW
jgi:hypothetical protein